MYGFIAIIAISVLTDIAMARSRLWRHRVPLSITTAILAALGVTGLVVSKPTVGSAAVAVVALYRLFHLRRILYGHSKPQYLKAVAQQTSLWLSAAQMLVLGIVLVAWQSSWTLRDYAITLAAVQLALAVGLFVSTRRQLRVTEPDITEAAAMASVKKMPSITVAVPARNEGAQMEACLTAILSSDYPKLEVLVLDDCSDDRTPEVIRGFAHDGVRFIRGAEPHEGWLAKNQAYARLAEEASGDYILFCGVDIRLNVQSVRRILDIALERHKSMVCVLPLNTQPRLLPLLQSMRYFWEMAPPRRLFQRPPVLSSCWLIKRSELQRAGGFAAVSRSVTPEAHFARHTADEDGYSFVRSNKELGISSEKTADGQRETAILTRYPQLHRRVEMVLALSAAELLLVFAAPVMLVVGLIAQWGWPLIVMTALTTVLQSCVYGWLQRSIFPRIPAYDAYSVFPLALLLDIVMLHYSMYAYEFSSVRWRDRNVTYPVMRRR